MTLWKPITKDKLSSLVKNEKKSLDKEELEFFNQHKLPLRLNPIRRFGKIEKVFLVLRFGDYVVFYDDIEGGFEITIIGENGIIEKYGTSQFELKHVIYQFMNNEISFQLPEKA